jgi:hypothetical protein
VGRGRPLPLEDIATALLDDLSGHVIEVDVPRRSLGPADILARVAHNVGSWGALRCLRANLSTPVESLRTGSPAVTGYPGAACVAGVCVTEEPVDTTNKMRSI